MKTETSSLSAYSISYFTHFVKFVTIFTIRLPGVINTVSRLAKPAPGDIISAVDFKERKAKVNGLLGRKSLWMLR